MEDVQVSNPIDLRFACDLPAVAESLIDTNAAPRLYSRLWTSTSSNLRNVMTAPTRQSDSGLKAPDTAPGPALTRSFYADLREVAGNLMRWERPGCSLQSTILVHDAFMALARQRNLQTSDRPALLAAAAQTMRRLLVDNARAGRRHKRGGKDVIGSLPTSLADDAKNIDVRELHDALNALKEHCETTTRIVEMRFFSGMTHAEIAQVTGLSERTIGEKWRFAKAWLYRAMNPDW